MFEFWCQRGYSSLLSGTPNIQSIKLPFSASTTSEKKKKKAAVEASITCGSTNGKLTIAVGKPLFCPPFNISFPLLLMVKFSSIYLFFLVA